MSLLLALTAAPVVPPTVETGWMGGGGWPNYTRPRRKKDEGDEPEIQAPELSPQRIAEVLRMPAQPAVSEAALAYIERLKSDIARADFERAAQQALLQQHLIAEIDNEVQRLLDERAAFAAQVLEEIDITYIAALMASM